MTTSLTRHFAAQTACGLRSEVRRESRQPEASGRLDDVHDLSELPAGNGDNQLQDRDPAQDDAGNGQPLVGGAPLIGRLNTQVAHDNRRDTRENQASDYTGDPETERPDPQ